MRSQRPDEAIALLEPLLAAAQADGAGDVGMQYDIVGPLAEAHRREGSPDRAAELLEPVYGWFHENFPDVPDTGRLALNLGWADVDLERDDEARALFEEADRTAPHPDSRAWAQVGLATLTRRRGPLPPELEASLSQARRQLAIRPGARDYELAVIDALRPEEAAVVTAVAAAAAPNNAPTPR
jgi:tetratricopeptide (TPR) repeat protein